MSSHAPHAACRASDRPLVLVPQFFGCLVFDRRSSRYMPFDRECADVLRRLVQEPIDSLRTRIDPLRRQAVVDLYDYFCRLGWFTLDGRLAAEPLDLVPPPDHLAGPLAVHLEIIAACNLACTHCFAGELPRSHDLLTLAEMDGLFAELASIGCYRLGLTGGEPLMRRDLFEILDAATQRGLHPCVTTNGLLISESTAREFGKRELVWLNVSLEGATAATNDLVRGAGAFQRVIDRLRLLGRHSRFTLAFTVMSTNVGEIEACARLAREVGAHAAVFRPLYPVGIASRHPELMPSYDDYAAALRRLGAVIEPNEDLHAIDPFSPQSRNDQQAKVFANNGCGAGNLVASVSAQGQVNPCSFLGPAFEAGNVRERPFAEIWRRSQVFRRMREAGDGAFRGGCRARALAFCGDVNGADPWHDAWMASQEGLPHPLSNWETHHGS